MAILCCPGCSNTYNVSSRVPHVFPCGHSLCASCLQHCEEVTCVTCKEKFASTTFPVNYSLKEELMKGQLFPDKEIFDDINWVCSECSLPLHPRQARICVRCIHADAASNSPSGMIISNYEKTETELICAHCAIESKHSFHITKLYLPVKIRQMADEKCTIMTDVVCQGGFSPVEASDMKTALKELKESSRELTSWKEFVHTWDEVETAIRGVSASIAKIKEHLATVNRITEQIERENENKQLLLSRLVCLVSGVPLPTSPVLRHSQSESDSESAIFPTSLRRYGAVEDLSENSFTL